MKAQHTSGPWFTNEGIPYVDKSLFNVWDAKGDVIARLYGEEANARLISAAPELLGALEGLVSLAHEAGFPCNKAEAAIDKARGLNKATGKETQ